MIYNPYEFLGVDKNVTKEQLNEVYQNLRKQYAADRFKPGEEGEVAAEKLQQIETAYQDILAEIDEKEQATRRAEEQAQSQNQKQEQQGQSRGLDEVCKLLSDNKLDEAQQALDAMETQDAEWHYVQSILFYKRNWFLESKKQLEIACNMDSGNERYKNSLTKLTKILASNTIDPSKMRTTSRPEDEDARNQAYAQGDGSCTGNVCCDICACSACCDCLSCTFR